jgi:hypothetical protein
MPPFAGSAWARQKYLNCHNPRHEQDVALKFMASVGRGHVALPVRFGCCKRHAPAAILVRFRIIDDGDRNAARYGKLSLSNSGQI